MARSLPERTVDSWVSSQITAAFPDALTWSPTQRLPDNWDMGARLGEGKAFLLENKGCDPDPAGSWHRVWINSDQLDRYLAEVAGQIEVFYILPDPPWSDGPTGSRYVPDEAWHRATCGEWLWVIRATQLRPHLDDAHAQPRWYASDYLAGLADTQALDEFLAAVRKCEYPELWTTQPRQPEPEQTSASKRLPGSPVGVFIPSASLEQVVGP